MHWSRWLKKNQAGIYDCAEFDADTNENLDPADLSRFNLILDSAWLIKGDSWASEVFALMRASLVMYWCVRVINVAAGEEGDHCISFINCWVDLTLEFIRI